MSGSRYTDQVTVSINNLLVKRGGFRLDVPSLAIRRGRITCVVGANGCGKTTLLESVVGLLTPTAGNVAVAGSQFSGHTVRPYIKRTIGYVPDDEAWIIPELTATEYFALLATMYVKAGITHNPINEVRRVSSALQFTQADQQLGSLSHGNKKKVQLIAGLMHRPRLLVVDELRNGLDPVAIKQAEALLALYKKRGVTILAASHDLWWAERFADEIVMLQEGRVVLQNTTRRIVAKSGSLEAKFMELYQHA